MRGWWKGLAVTTKTRPRGRIGSRVALAWAALVSAVLVSTGMLGAASSQAWEFGGYEAFAAGTFRNVSLSPEGGLRLGPRIDEVFSADQPLIWASVVAPDGSVYLGTGHQGHVYKIGPGGESRLFWKAPEIEVFALAVAEDGTVFAGTSPNGKIYRLSAEGEAEEFFDPGETYIWSLVIAERGAKSGGGGFTLYAGTGERGKIYRVEVDGPGAKGSDAIGSDAKGSGELYYDSGQRHVVSLAFDGEGRLLAGTDPNGILLRVESKGRAFTLYDSDLPEIRGLEVAANGDIYAAAVGGGMTDFPLGVAAPSLTAGGAAAVTIEVSAASSAGIQPGDPAVPATKQSAGPSTPAAAATAVISFGVGEKSALLRIRPGVETEKLWSSQTENVLDLKLVSPEGGQLLFATDRRGRLYRLGEDRQAVLLAETGQQQVTRFAARGDDLWLATAHSAKLLRFSSEASEHGVYKSPPRDAGTISRWGRFFYRGQMPSGAALEITTRGGNSARPDGTWSDWSAPIGFEKEGEWRGGAIASPSSRYFQWRVSLRGAGGKTPSLEKARITYLPHNRAPVITRIELSTSENSEASAKTSSAAQAAGAAPDAAYSITVTAGDDTALSSGASSPKKTAGGVRREVTISWTAEDPDGDELIAALRFRGEGETTWKLIKDEITKSSHSIESDMLADGVYQFEVEVSDNRVNPGERARSAKKVSEVILVDHTPPMVRFLSTSNRNILHCRAEDQASGLQRAEYSVDAGRWMPVLSDDGIIDSQRENFTIRLDGLAPGEHLVTMRVRDRAGNAGLAKTMVR